MNYGYILRSRGQEGRHLRQQSQGDSGAEECNRAQRDGKPTVSLRSQLGAHPGEEDRQSQSDGGENMTVRVLISPKRSVRVLAGLTQLGLGRDGIL